MRAKLLFIATVIVTGITVRLSCLPTALRLRPRGDRGQTTAEYALVLVGAAALALLLISWASKSDQIGKLFNFVIDHITGKVA